MADSGSTKAKFKFVSIPTRLPATFRNEATHLYQSIRLNMPCISSNLLQFNPLASKEYRNPSLPAENGW